MQGWVRECSQVATLREDNKARDVKWTENIAVGSKEFVEKIKEKLGALFLSRKVEGKEGRYELHDPQRPYGITENSFQWRNLQTAISAPFS